MPTEILQMIVSYPESGGLSLAQTCRILHEKTDKDAKMNACFDAFWSKSIIDKNPRSDLQYAMFRRTWFDDALFSEYLVLAEQKWNSNISPKRETWSFISLGCVHGLPVHITTRLPLNLLNVAQPAPAATYARLSLLAKLMDRGGCFHMDYDDLEREGY